jgi:hypothetical protein
VALVGLLLFIFLLELDYPQPREITDIESFLGIPLILIALMPFFLYNGLYDKVKSVRYAMLPASQTEKVASAVIQANILIPALLVIVFWISMFIINSIRGSAEITVI